MKKLNIKQLLGISLILAMFALAVTTAKHLHLHHLLLGVGIDMQPLVSYYCLSISIPWL